MPISGSISSSSTVNTAIIPNQTGKNPSAKIMEYTTGKVITSVARYP